MTRPTREELGKNIATEAVKPRPQVLAPELNEDEIAAANTLTLIGRVTNPIVQRVWSVLPGLPQNWRLKGRVVGADLGKGRFKFTFDLEEDVTLVLANRPYQFARYMIILQRWSPSVSDDFPSEIPFWIRVKGLPSHYANLDMVDRIGNTIGKVEEKVVTNEGAKVRVIINGLEPLATDAAVTFSNGTEIIAQLEYEKLRNYCTGCNRLSHDLLHCPLRESQNELVAGHRKVAAPRASSKSHSQYSAPYQKQRPPVSRQLHWHSQQESLASKRRYEDIDQSVQDGAALTTRKGQTPRINKVAGSSPYHPHVRVGETRDHYQSRSYPQPAKRSRFDNSTGMRQEWRQRPSPEDEPIVRDEEHSRTALDRLSVHEEGATSSKFTTLKPPRSIEEIMTELKEVMMQYVSCSDPNESAVRRRRLAQCESAGVLQEKAERILEVEAKRREDNGMIQLAPTLVQGAQSLNQAENLPSQAEVGQETFRKKRGRPPVSARLQFPVDTTHGAGPSVIRKVRKVARSPKVLPTRARNAPKRLIHESVGQSSSRQRKQKRSEMIVGTNVVDSAQPPVSLIPAVVREEQDFHELPRPLP